MPRKIPRHSDLISLGFGIELCIFIRLFWNSKDNSNAQPKLKVTALVPSTGFSIFYYLVFNLSMYLTFYVLNL